MEYEAVIGLETHVQLKTRSKMWCGCAIGFGAPPNTNVCPVCLGLPGVLPVANDEALRLTVLTGLMLNSKIPAHAKFDRKNYFYPDSAKNYQITQYDRPSTEGGWLEFEYDGPGSCDGLARVKITRAHLEEDVGKNVHFDRFSGVDFNRAGVPLLEIVSEPDLTNSAMAYEYLTSLTAALVREGISDCDMEKGMVRCDVNISVRPKGSQKMGAKVEIKNMNTFSGVRRALDYEIPRQMAVVAAGGVIPQETRRWDELAGVTETMRSKEDAHDYRYFPEPDLMPFAPIDEWIESVRSRLVEMPLALKKRLIREYRIPAGDAEVLTNDWPLANYFERAVQGAKNSKAVANWLINNLRARLGQRGCGLEDIRFPISAIGELVELVDSGKISSKIAQEVFEQMFERGGSPSEIVEQNGLLQVSDSGSIEEFCREVIVGNPKSADDFRSGKPAALNFLKGQVMKLSKGKANPGVAGEVLERLLQS